MPPSVHSDIVHTAGFVPVRGAADDEVLLLRAYRLWDFPKGVTGPNETLLTAAFRELREEVGWDAAQMTFPWGQASITTQPYRSRHGTKTVYKQAHFFVARVMKDTAPPRLSDEHRSFSWLPWEVAVTQVVPRLQAVLHEAQSRVKAAMPSHLRSTR